MKARQPKSRNVYSHLPTRSTKITRGTHYCHLLSDWKDISSSPRLSRELISISSGSSRDIKELPLMYVFKTIILIVKKLSNSSKNKRLQDNLEIFFILLLILTKRKWKIRRFKMITASSGKLIVPENPTIFELGDWQTTTREWKTSNCLEIKTRNWLKHKQTISRFSTQNRRRCYRSFQKPLLNSSMGRTRTSKLRHWRSWAHLPISQKLWLKRTSSDRNWAGSPFNFANGWVFLDFIYHKTAWYKVSLAFL